MPEAILDEEVERRIRKRFGDRITMTKSLKGWGITPEAYRQRVHDDIILEYMKMKNVSSIILVSPQKIEQYYTTNRVQFQLGDEVKLRMIVLSRVSPKPADQVREMAQEIVTILDKGASFSEMAAIYSEGTQRRESGDWGWVTTNSIARGLADVAFYLKPGQHSRVLGLAKDKEETDSYWLYQYDEEGKIAQAKRYNERKGKIEETPIHVLQSGTNSLNAVPDTFYIMAVEDKRPARTKPINEVRDVIEAELKRHEQDQLYKKWIDRLKAKSFVRYFS